MTHALTLTLPLKQDAASQNKLASLAANFAEHVQPAIAEALKKSQSREKPSLLETEALCQIRRDRLHGHAQLAQLQRALAHHVAGAVDEALAQGAVRDDEDADHRPILGHRRRPRTLAGRSRNTPSAPGCA